MSTDFSTQVEEATLPTSQLALFPFHDEVIAQSLPSFEVGLESGQTDGPSSNMLMRYRGRHLRRIIYIILHADDERREN